MSQRNTQFAIQQRMNKGMEKESRRKEFMDRAKFENQIRLANSANQRAESIARRNNAAQSAAEQYLEKQWEQRVTEAQQKQRIREQDAALAEELASRKREKEMWEREIQRICEADPSLKELQSKLKAAYMNKERSSQVQEKRYISKIEAEQEAYIDDQMERDRINGLHAEASIQHMRLENNRAARVVLERQVEEAQRIAREEGMAEFLRDKAMVDAIVRAVNEEDRADAEAKARKQRESKRFIDQFKADQAAYRQRVSDEQAAEEQRIAEYAAAQQAREEGVKQRKAKRAAEAEQIFRQLAAEHERKEAEFAEMEQLRMMLWEEETEKRLLEQDAAREAQRARMRFEMQEANEYQKALKAANREAEWENELAMRRAMQDKFAADDEAEARIRDERARLREEYMAGLREQREERRRLYEAEVEAERQRQREEEEREEFRARVVEEARRRLLAEHASVLDGYLPKGVLQSKADLDLIQSKAAAADGSRSGRGRGRGRSSPSAEGYGAGGYGDAARGGGSRGGSRRGARGDSSARGGASGRGNGGYGGGFGSPDAAQVASARRQLMGEEKQQGRSPQPQQQQRSSVPWATNDDNSKGNDSGRRPRSGRRSAGRANRSSGPLW